MSRLEEMREALVKDWGRSAVDIEYEKEGEGHIIICTTPNNKKLQIMLKMFEDTPTVLIEMYLFEPVQENNELFLQLNHANSQGIGIFYYNKEKERIQYESLYMTNDKAYIAENIALYIKDASSIMYQKFMK